MITTNAGRHNIAQVTLIFEWIWRYVVMRERNEMGNMSILEQKVEVLLRFCMAQTDEERQMCRSDVGRLCLEGNKNSPTVDHRGRIEKMLRELGIPEHLNGFSFLRSALLLLVEQPELCQVVSTVLYPQVARAYNTSVGTVERGIRYAIETGWMRCDERTQRRIFGNQIDPQKAKPTNCQFLICVSNLIRRSISGLQN